MIVGQYIISRQFDQPEDPENEKGYVLLRELKENDQPGALVKRYRFLSYKDQLTTYIKTMNRATELSRNGLAKINLPSKQP